MRNRRTVTGKTKRIPPLPGPEEGYDAIIAYFNKYSTEELEKAGYLEEVSPEEIEELAASAAYQLLCRDGLHVQLARKDCKLLSRLAAQKDTGVEILVKRWIAQRLRQEAQQLAAGTARSATAGK
jgi:hypothetical protein